MFQKQRKYNNFPIYFFISFRYFLFLELILFERLYSFQLIEKKIKELDLLKEYSLKFNIINKKHIIVIYTNIQFINNKKKIFFLAFFYL